MKRKLEKVGGLHQFRHDDPAIVGGERGVVDVGAVVVPEADEARVLDAVALRGRGGEQDALATTAAPAGTGLRSWTGPASRSPARRPGPPATFHPAGGTARAWRLARRSSSANESPSLFMTRRVNSPVNPSFSEFPLEQRLLVDGVRNLARLGEKARGGQDLDPLIGMDDAGAKRDGGDVPFAGGAQAENEPQRAGRQTRLVGVRHDGRIEQGRGFQRVFGQEIGADQEPPCFGQLSIRPATTRAPVRSARRKRLRICWCRCENSAETSSSSRPTLVFRKRHDPGDDPGDPLGTTRAERPQEERGTGRD